MRRSRRRLDRIRLGAALAMLVGCAGRVPPPAAPAPMPRLRFNVLGGATPSDTGAPSLLIRGSTLVIRGRALRIEGAGLYGDLDLSEPHTLRLTLYDSLSGRPISDPIPPSEQRQVVYEARIGPVQPGEYDVWVGKFDAKAELIEVPYAAVHIRVEPDEATRFARLGAVGPPAVELLPDGGRLAVAGASTGPDNGSAIRALLGDVATSYARSEFSWPRGSDGAPPDAELLAGVRDRVHYSVEPLPRGGALRLRGDDSAAVAAVGAFLDAIEAASH